MTLTARHYHPSIDAKFNKRVLTRLTRNLEYEAFMSHYCCNIGTMIWTCSSSSWNRCNDVYWSLLLAAFLQIEFHLSFLLTVLWNAINNPGRWSLCFIKCEGFLAMICDSYRSSTTSSVTTVWPILRPHFLKRKYILRNSQCIEPPVQSSILLCFGRAI